MEARTIALSEEGFAVTFPYDPVVVAAVKLIPGRRPNPSTWVWTVPCTQDSIEALARFAHQHKFSITKEALSRMQNARAQFAQNIQASRASFAEIEVPGLGGELFPFQKAGVAYAVRSKRTFIADEMGLGKTCQALATIQYLNAYPALVICPASVKLFWGRETRKWLPGKSVAVLNGSDTGDYRTAEVVVINYDVLKKWMSHLQAIRFQAIVLDEIHFVKSHTAQRTKFSRELAKNVPIRLGLSGTPIVNRPKELISQLQILGRLEEMGGFWHFSHYFCNAVRDKWGLNLDGASNLPELNQKLRSLCFIRRKKQDVLKELPEKRKAILPVEISNWPEYRKAEKEFISWLWNKAAEDQEFLGSIQHLSEKEQALAIHQHQVSTVERARRAEQLVKVEKLKALAAEGKMKAVIEWVEDFLETGEKLVIFGHHRATVRKLASTFQAPSITGDTPVPKRQEAIDCFQSDPSCKLIVLNIRAGGIGITLTAASHVLFVEQDWTPAAHDQAEDRLHRIGQYSSVLAWYMLGRDTIDEQIHALIAQKREIVNQATEGEQVASILDDLLSNLMTHGK